MQFTTKTELDVRLYQAGEDEVELEIDGDAVLSLTLTQEHVLNVSMGDEAGERFTPKTDGNIYSDAYEEALNQLKADANALRGENYDLKAKVNELHHELTKMASRAAPPVGKVRVDLTRAQLAATCVAVGHLFSRSAPLVPIREAAEASGINAEDADPEDCVLGIGVSSTRVRDRINLILRK